MVEMESGKVIRQQPEEQKGEANKKNTAERADEVNQKVQLIRENYNWVENTSLTFPDD